MRRSNFLGVTSEKRFSVLLITVCHPGGSKSTGGPHLVFLLRVGPAGVAPAASTMAGTMGVSCTTSGQLNLSNREHRPGSEYRA